MLHVRMLPGWEVLETERSEAGLRLRVRAADGWDHCPRCGAPAEALTGHGQRDQQFTEAPIAGHRASLLVSRRRQRCASCGAVTPQPLPLAMDRHRITVRCRDQIIEQSRLLPLLQVARQVGVHREVVQSLAGARFKPRGRPRTASAPEVQQCGFCLRVFPVRTMHAHHPLPAGLRANPLQDLTPLCPECHRSGCQKWIGEGEQDDR